MRGIKFRAWDGKSMQYDVTGFEHDQEFGMIGVFIDGEYYLVNKEYVYQINEGIALYDSAEVMQYTGMKDKNGLEIYEGDIVSWVNATGFEDGQAVVEWEVRGAWYIVNNERNVFDFLDDVLIDCQVIGNINQNPELMEETNV
jgi:uncharacterized phage protein (TIGR01671 family)